MRVSKIWKSVMGSICQPSEEGNRTCLAGALGGKWRSKDRVRKKASTDVSAHSSPQRIFRAT